MQIEVLKSKIHRVAVKDKIIIVSYAGMDFEEAKKHKPQIIFPDDNNKIPI